MSVTPNNYPAKYLLYNQQLSKQLAIVMVIEDVPYIFGIGDTFEVVTWGTPGLVWGQAGLVWGGLKKIGGPNNTGAVRSFIQLDPSMRIQQRIEPEQGRGNIGTINMTLIDYQGQVSYLIAPGNVVPEIMCGKQTTIYVGFQQTSFPVDFLILYRGYITGLDTPPGQVRFTISDGTMKSRQPIANQPTTILTSDILSTDTLIPVGSTSGFYAQIKGPDGTYNNKVHTYIQIDSEFMEYAYNGITSPTQFTVTRGSFGTPTATHNAGASVANMIQLGFPGTGQGINFIDLALGLLLSGWDGPCETNIPCNAIGISPTNLTGFSLGVQNGLQVDAFNTLGLTIGDWFYVTGATDPGNNISGQITGFENDDNGYTSIIETNQTFGSYEFPTNAVIAFRSKHDIFPVGIGAQCRMRDVDVFTWETIQANFFLSSVYDVSVFYDTPIFAQDTIATDLCLPMGCYTISRFGRISLSVTKPPLPGGTQRLVQLDWTNILHPEKIHVQRTTTNRTFYNQISFEFDFDPGSGNFATIQYFLDTQSLTNFDQTLTLPITAKALYSVLGNGVVASQRGQALLTRYANVAIILELTVNWSAGSQIEVSDIVLVVDNGKLQIMNFATGVRNLGSQLFEVIDRTYNVTEGTVSLKVLSGLGFDVNSRFGLISPSSNINSGSTSSTLRLLPSFGQTTIAGEISKWSPFLGLPIVVHNQDFSITGTSTLVSLDPLDPTALDITPPLGFTPATGFVLEIADYPTGTDKLVNSQYKALYAYITPTVAVVTGISTTQFTVGAGDVAKFTAGNTVLLRKIDYSQYTQEVTLSTIVGTTLTVTPALHDSLNPATPITPNNTWVVEGIGFHDKTGFYRYT